MRPTRTKNICNDAHDCSLATADTWLKGWLPKIMAGADFKSGNLAVVVTADEDDRNSGNKVLTTVLHPSLDGAHKVVSSPLTHYSLTAFYDDVIGAPRLRNAANAPPMADAFGLATGAASPTPSPTLSPSPSPSGNPGSGRCLRCTPSTRPAPSTPASRAGASSTDRTTRRWSPR